MLMSVGSTCKEEFLAPPKKKRAARNPWSVKGISRAMKQAAEAEASKKKKLSYQACHKVLDTAESLEMILFNVYEPRDAFVEDTKQKGLRWFGKCPKFEQSCSDIRISRRDMKTLLLSQRVNRMFKGTIEGSIKIQKALWFNELFETSPSGTQGAERAPNIVRANPLLIGWEEGPLQIERLRHSWNTSADLEIRLSKAYSWHSDAGSTLSAVDMEMEAFREESETGASEINNSDHENASWRGMLVAQSTQPVWYNITALGLRFGCGDLAYRKPVLAGELRDRAHQRDMPEEMRDLLDYDDSEDDDGESEDDDEDGDEDEDGDD
ncbi:hypothetical protein CKM354_000466200 [Cercospora kikuchii]|uniref:Uncharacterized protein n=1 Tax=Cercospora kikuchii TaxID=84275 RepID=A0A9P3FBJ5_9PEZI|nr:uncharacterized protein CKM354_000466200 [Cercospora kikuchii]GIZ41356.1 hypothetical protein CKM354_000466200 [Cercospora kikuchii]